MKELGERVHDVKIETEEQKETVMELINHIIHVFTNEGIFLEKDIQHWDEEISYLFGGDKHKFYKVLDIIYSYFDLAIDQDPLIYCRTLLDFCCDTKHKVLYRQGIHPNQSKEFEEWREDNN